MDDLVLLRQYSEEDSEAAFEELVARRVGFVYSSALRQTRDPLLAEEVTQAVFVLLAQRAETISDKTILTGWLFKAVRFIALARMRAAAKRTHRTALIEKEFQMQIEVQSPADDETWNKISPLLDGALAALGEKDRQAILLRYFENKSLAEVSRILASGEDGARKRVSRALVKLRNYFSKRGVHSTTAILAGAISAGSVHDVPDALARSISAAAAAKGAFTSASTLTLIKGALKIMAWTKVKTVVAVSAGALLVAGTTTMAIRTIHNRNPSWREPNVGTQALDNTSPQVSILSSRFNQFRGLGIDAQDRILGLGVPFADLVQVAYSNNWARAVLPSDLSTRRFDFIANLPSGSRDRLRKTLEKQLHVTARSEVRQTDVLVLRVARRDAAGLKATPVHGGSDCNTGRIQFMGQALSEFSNYLEKYFEIPVVDQTGLTGFYTFNLIWNEQVDQKNPDGLKQVMLEKLGLELAPSRESLEMLVLERTRN